jgi:hypothetical protein
MSRSGYCDDYEEPALTLWRQAVENAIKGKRGQALLKELEAALVALPDKALVADDMARPDDDAVCALGAIVLKRGLDKGKDRLTVLKEIAEKYPEGLEAEELADDFNIAAALAKEITYINDEMAPCKPQQRYEYVLKWVRDQIVPSKG